MNPKKSWSVIATCIASQLLITPVGSSADGVQELLQQAKTEEKSDPEELIQALQPIDIVKIGQLRTALVHADPVYRKTAVMLLGRLGDPVTKMMARLLKDEDESVREAAERALVALGPRSVEDVGSLLLAEPISSGAKVRALEILRETNHPSAAHYLYEAVLQTRGQDFDHKKCIEGLAALGPLSTRYLYQLLQFDRIGGYARYALGGFPSDGLGSAFLLMMGDPQEDLFTRMQAAHYAEQMLGTRAIAESLVEFYNSVIGDDGAPPTMRREAETRVRKIKFPRIVDGKESFVNPGDPALTEWAYKGRGGTVRYSRSQITRTDYHSRMKPSSPSESQPGYITGRRGVTITHEIEPMTPLERRRAARLEETRREQRETRMEERDREVSRLRKRYQRKVRELDRKDAQLNQGIGWIRDAQGNPVRDETVPTPPPRATGFKRERERLKEDYQRDMQRIREEYEELYPDNWPGRSDR